MSRRARIASTTAALVACAYGAIALNAQQRSVAATKFTRAPMIQAPPPGEIEVLPIRGNLYALFGAGSNIVVSVGPDGAMLVDAGKAGMSDKILAAVQQLSREWAMRSEPKPLGWGAETRSSVADRHITAPPKPIRYIMNTTVDADHVGGNARLRSAGHTFTGGNVVGNIADAAEGAAILAHENVLTRLAASGGEGQNALPPDALPTDTYFEEAYKLSHYFNGEGVRLLHMPNAHTDGDSIVYFRGTDVIALGDIMSTGAYPVIDVARGGTINGIAEALNRAIDLAQTEFRLEGGTLIVPGHGRMVDSADVAYYRDMLTIIRDRVEAMVKKNMTLEQVVATNPTGDYDTEYGSTSGEWTTRQFIEAVYRTLGGGKAASAPAARRPARKP